MQNKHATISSHHIHSHQEKYVLKSQCDIISNTLLITKFKVLNMGQLDFSPISVCTNGITTSGKHLVIFFYINLRTTLQPTNSTHGYLLKGNEV